MKAFKAKDFVNSRYHYLIIDHGKYHFLWNEAEKWEPGDNCTYIIDTFKEIPSFKDFKRLQELRETVDRWPRGRPDALREARLWRESETKNILEKYVNSSHYDISDFNSTVFIEAYSLYSEYQKGSLGEVSLEQYLTHHQEEIRDFARKVTNHKQLNVS